LTLSVKGDLLALADLTLALALTVGWLDMSRWSIEICCYGLRLRWTWVLLPAVATHWC